MVIKRLFGGDRDQTGDPSDLYDEILPQDLDVAKSIRMSLLKESDREQRMMSKTFWSRFGIKVRKQPRVVRVEVALASQGIQIVLDGEFGKEQPNDWIVLSLPNALAWPDDRWFKRMREREFESEREVEYYFVLQLLEQLGYQEENFSLHHNLIVHQGAKAMRMQADIAVFADEFRNDAILVVEVKHVNSSLKQRDFGQAKSYAIELSSPLYLVTNGDDSRLMALNFGRPDEELLAFRRSQLKDQWPTIIEYLSRDAVASHKHRLRNQLEG